MKIVQTFWAGNVSNPNPLSIKAGWLFPEYHWMSWALSCLLLRKQYDFVELYTDEIGKYVLVDIFQLPYSEVHIVFDNKFQVNSEIFALAKIKTYSLQKEMFIHVDGDVFIWKSFPNYFVGKDVIASNLEKNLFFNKEILFEMEMKFQNIPSHLKGVYNSKNIYASNAGIFGGSNIPFIQRYCEEAFKLIELNQAKLKDLNTGGLNWLIEQISLFYLAKQEDVPIDYFVQEAVSNPMYQDFWRFSDIPNVSMVHPVGGCKREHYVLNHLAKRLRLEFPDFYYNILKQCKRNGIEIKNLIYNYIDLEVLTVKKDLSSSNGFLNVINPELFEVSSINFEEAYRRTILVIEFYFNYTISSKEVLVTLIENSEMPNQVMEIYFLESEKLLQYDRLVLDFQKGENYAYDLDIYKTAAEFFLTPDWINTRIELRSEVIVLNMEWDWFTIAKELERDKIAKILEEEKNEFFITLSHDCLSIQINETYHEDLDAVILQIVKDGTTVLNLLNEVKLYFDDIILIGNMEYQKLIFDIIKRLLFENIIVVKY